jgi:drug/metabolite transporter (DMT)-like permease
LATFILKRDNLRLGIVLGLLGPVLGLVIIYFAKFSSYGFGEFLDLFFTTNKLITSIGALCLLANAIIFTFYINTHRDATAKGVFLTTLIYGVAILILKLFN